MNAAAFGLGLILLVLPFAAQSDENLVDKREFCRQQARVQIAPRGKIGVDDFRRVVERRAVHVRACMSRPFVARNDQPLPPKRALDVSSLHQEPATGSVRKQTPVTEKSADRRKLQIRTAKGLKGKSLKGKKSSTKKRGRASRSRR